ncbi:hypothetical protein [Pendulispora albinea]|uniref:Response regulator n=1 Tax=Pendulispora albinea TaxID=2741071 RepID=A0ABZ2LTU6_9BACT
MKRAYVMVVDDEAPARERLTRLLRSAGYVVCPTSNGDEAVEMLHAAGRLPDLILVCGEAAKTKSAFYTTLMRSPALSRISYLAIASRFDDVRASSFEVHGLLQLIDRLAGPPPVFSTTLERRAVRV